MVEVFNFSVGTMEKVHVSIQKGFSIPPLRKCKNCCSPSRIHCPFCSPAFFKPTKPSRARLHLDNHLRRAIYVGDYTIHRCGLECRNQPHYHCLYCTATLIRKRDFTRHLPLCRQAQRSKVKKLSSRQIDVTRKVQTEAVIPSRIPGESDVPSYDIESEDDDDDDNSVEITIIPDSDDIQEASSSQSVTPISPNSSEHTVRAMERTRQPDFSKCDKTVQTNIEKPQDCDEHYFMSLVKMFKKLSPQKKAGVRMKIERLLFEAEFQ